MRLHKPIGDSGVTDEARRQSPTDYFGDGTPAHIILFIIYPTYSSIDLKESLGKKGDTALGA